MTSPYIHTNLSNGTTYYYIVTAVNSIGESTASAEVSCTPVSAWSTLGSGVNDVVYSIACDLSGNVYAAGEFTTAGGASANYIAVWNGSKWSPIGSMNNRIFSLVYYPKGVLYAGGAFNSSGSTTLNYIAKQNGAYWSALRTGLGTYVYTLACDSKGNLFVGGFFTKANNSSTALNRIAKWNPSTSTWSALRTGMDDSVSALAFDSSGNLYAGGLFSTAGTTTVNYIAKWNGSSWSALDSGVSGHVYALALDSSGNLYIGGGFSYTGGGILVNNIVKYKP